QNDRQLADPRDFVRAPGHHAPGSLPCASNTASLYGGQEGANGRLNRADRSSQENLSDHKSPLTMTDRDREFIREVDEAVRQDQYKKLWDQYGIYALAAAVVLVAGVAGYKGWIAWQEKKSGEAGAKFTQALTVEEGPDAAKANDILASLVKDGPEGYRI